MGIYNRDYLRDDESPRGFSAGGGDHWQVWQQLLAITVGAFVLQILFDGTTGSFTRWLELSFNGIFREGRIWSLLTYAFLHDTSPGAIFHILFNMIVLYFFGRRIESMYGGKEFGLFYCAAAIFAGMFYLAFGFFIRDLVGVIGASGAVMGLVILYALHFPREAVYFWGLIRIEMRWLAAIIILIDLYPMLNQLAGSQPSDGVAHAAHLGGAIFAWLYFSRRLRLAPYWDAATKWIRKPQLTRPRHLKIYREEPEQNLDAEVDRILQKIQNSGEASLTDKERKTLQTASERYKNRQRQN